MTKSDILNQENKLHKAIRDGDIMVLDELLHNDLLFIIPNGEVITKEMDLKTYSDGNMKIDELIPNIEDITIIDDVAVLTLTIELKGSYNNLEFENKYRYIRFWKVFSTGIKVIGGSGIVINH